MRSTSELPAWGDEWILSRRPPRPAVDPSRAHAAFVEPERTREGAVEDVLTVLLVNRECPFRCLMCDLWKYTTTERVAAGVVARQVEEALRQFLPSPPRGRGGQECPPRQALQRRQLLRRAGRAAGRRAAHRRAGRRH